MTPQGLAESLAEAATYMSASRSLAEQLDAIVHTALRSLSGIDHIGISVARRSGEIETMASTDPLVWQLDQLQREVGEGPCLYALEHDSVVVVDYAGHEQRWPKFISRAVDLGLRSQLALKLYSDDQTYGSMNLYSTSSDTIDPETAHLAGLFATHAALVLGHANTEQDLTEALQSRQVIGVACGLVMERYRIDQGRAFAFLSRASQTSNVKVRVLAQELVDEATRAYRPVSTS